MIGKDLELYLADVPAFRWGGGDCAALAIGWVERVEGVTLPRLRARGSIASARAAMLQYGQTVDAAATAILCRQPIPVSMARTGDLVMLKTPVSTGLGGALGICAGSMSAHVGRAGIVWTETALAVTAWPIGRST